MRRFWNLTTVCLTLAALCTCLAVALVAIEAYGDEPGLVQQVHPRQVQAPSPPPRAEDLPATVKRDYKGPSQLVVTSGAPKLDKLVKLDQLDAESREIADILGGTDDTVARVGDKLYVGISDGNKFARAGEVLATYTWRSNCSNNSGFTPNDEALTHRAHKRAMDALVAWTAHRHTPKLATMKVVNYSPGHVDVQLNFPEPVAVAPVPGFQVGMIPARWHNRRTYQVKCGIDD